MCVILAWFLSPRPKQTEWCHDPQPSQPTEDITAVLDSSIAQFGDMHGSSWLSFSTLRALACWRNMRLKHVNIVLGLLFSFWSWCTSLFGDVIFILFWRFNADLLLKSFLHSEQLKSASSNRFLLAMMDLKLKFKH